MLGPSDAAIVTLEIGAKFSPESLGFVRSEYSSRKGEETALARPPLDPLVPTGDPAKLSFNSRTCGEGEAIGGQSKT